MNLPSLRHRRGKKKKSLDGIVDGVTGRKKKPFRRGGKSLPGPKQKREGRSGITGTLNGWGKKKKKVWKGKRKGMNFSFTAALPWKKKRGGGLHLRSQIKRRKKMERKKRKKKT